MQAWVDTEAFERLSVVLLYGMTQPRSESQLSKTSLTARRLKSTTVYCTIFISACELDGTLNVVHCNLYSMQSESFA